MAPGVAKTFIKELHKVLSIRYPDSIFEDGRLEENSKLTVDGVKNRLKQIREADPNGLILNHLEQIKGIIENEFMCELDSDTIDKCIAVALKYTRDATNQAMEAVVHNLNSMHCLPYDEKLWVLDTKKNTFEPMEIGKLTENFEVNRYKVVSLNTETGKAEFKYVTAAKDMGNNREIVELTNNQGAKVRVTDNHRVMTIRDRKIVADYPEQITHTVTPRFIKTPTVNNDICIEGYGRLRKDTPYQENHVIVSEAFAELMGYYVADGSLIGDTGTLCFTTCGKVPFDEMEKLMEEAFGVKFSKNVTYYENSKTGNSEKDIRFGVSRRVTRMIADKFGKGSYEKKIPAEILFATDNIKSAFLKAYFRCDGRRGKNYSEASSVNKELTLELAFMIQSLGGSVHYTHREHSNDYVDSVEMHTITLSGHDSLMVGIKDIDNTAFSIPKYDLSMLGLHSTRQNGNLRYEELEDEVCTGRGDLEKFLNVYFNPVEVTSKYNSGDTHVYDISVEDNETFLTCEGIYVHNSRAGAQVPFSSLNFGTDISEEGRMVSFALLKATDEGLGNGETPIFPISIFKMKSGVNFNKEDPNYDLFKESIRVSAKRLFPKQNWGLSLQENLVNL